jgi:hypothetical protein
MPNDIPLTIEIEDPAPGARRPVTLISNPWIRLVATRRVPFPDPVPMQGAGDRAA